MAHLNKVMQPINLPGEMVCVDIFQRPDGTFGFDEFRREPEDGRGWFSIVYYGEQVFQSFADAKTEAQRQVRWLEEVETQA